MLHGVNGSTGALLVSGAGTMTNGTVMGKAIPYQLADTGDYDVWMMNARGNF